MVLNETHTYEDIYLQIKELGEQYEDFATTKILGISHDGRAIPMIRIGLGVECLVLTAGIHGKESINPVLIGKLAEEYCQLYKKDQTIEGYPVRNLLNQYAICMIPMVNPDGYEIAMNGFDVIRNPVLRQKCKMRGIRHEYWKYNARGVDINRNFPCKSYIQQQFGEYPASEKETQALIRLFSEYETVGYIDFHSRGRIIYYYRHGMPLSYNQKNHCLAQSMQKISDYTIGKKEEEYFSNLNGGTPIHYYSELLKKPAITIETVDNHADFPLHPSYQEQTYQEIRLLPLEIMNKT